MNLKLNLSFVLGVLLFVDGCGVESMSSQLPEIKSDLLAITAKLGSPPEGEMYIISKQDVALVSFTFRTKDRKEFLNKLGAVARERGYSDFPVDKKLPHPDSLVLCSTRNKYRSLDASPTEKGVMSVTIVAAKPRMFGSGLCAGN